MNRLGGRSNSGEGGEDPARLWDYQVIQDQTSASGRFRCNPPLILVNAEVLQIKVAPRCKTRVRAASYLAVK